MTWTKVSDDWTDRADLASLPFDYRWHYLAMIQLCSRGGIIDGHLRKVDARRCSDVPDPDAALKALVRLDLLEVTDVGYAIVEIQEHIPPLSVRNKAENDKLRKRRQRAHNEGDHRLCSPDNCSHTPVTADVPRDKSSDSGTGQDGPGPTEGGSDAFSSVTSEIGRSAVGWPAVVPGEPGRWAS